METMFNSGGFPMEALCVASPVPAVDGEVASWTEGTDAASKLSWDPLLSDVLSARSLIVSGISPWHWTWSPSWL